MANTVDKVIKIAEAEVGYLEKKTNKDLNSKTANAGYNNYTKYGKEMHDIYPAIMDFPAPWCDAFVDWCFMKAYGIATAKSLLDGNFDDYTVASAQMFKNKKAWYTSNPKVGDQIFFKDSNGGICHTGLVYKVDNFYVYTIEGNTSGNSGVIANGGGVFKKAYQLNYSRIAGYGRPKYDVETKANASTKKKAYTGTLPTLKKGQYFKKGDKGADVLKIQKFLLWYDKNCLPKYGADSDYGDETTKAVKAFQKANGLLVDGEFGEKSLAKAKELKK